MLGIDELIVFTVESTAEWRRRTVERFPEDHRNVEAAGILERLAPELRALEGTALHERVARLAEEDEDGNFSGILSELLRTVGFGSFPPSGKDLLDEFVFNLELRPELKSSSVYIAHLGLTTTVSRDSGQKDERR